MISRIICGLTLLLIPASLARAEVQSKEIKYKSGNLECIGYLAWDDANDQPRPGILVLHEWWGLNEYAKQRTNQLARMGYVAFAADLYGEGKTVEHPQEAGKMAAAVRQNVQDWQQRAVAGLEVLTKQPQCDREQLAAIGYCFGGSSALQLAMTGADLDAVVTFHGALPVPTDEEAAKIKASVLICHGADDSFIPEDTIKKFRAALDKANVDWDMVYYGGARHSFTVPDADQHGIEGIKYDKNADRRSWAHMRQMLQEKFGRQDGTQKAERRRQKGEG